MNFKKVKIFLMNFLTFGTAIQNLLSAENNFFQTRSQNREKRLLSSAMSVRPFACNNSATAGGIFMTLDI